MKRLLVLVALLAVVWPLTAQDTPPATQDLPPPAPDLLGPLTFSTKIWDDPSWANLSGKAHKALGYATVTLGSAAILVQKFQSGGGEDDAAPGHQFLGEAAAIGAGAEVAIGLLSHWDKLSFQGDLFTWHNLHALVALAGASSMAGAGLVAPGEAHSNLGIAGTILMALAIILEG